MLTPRAPLSVAGLLALPQLTPARPEVLAGTDLENRMVRWVHTSEIYEIAPLLEGGEVLLTTGLGLVGQPPEALVSYIESLARREVAALVLELGRTFVAPPAAMVNTARRHGLPLIALHGVVPFVRITEAVHPVLMSAQVDRLQAVESAGSRLNRALLAGATPAELLDLIGDLCGGPVGLDRDGRITGDPVSTAHRLELTGQPGAALLLSPAASTAWSPRLGEACTEAMSLCLHLANRVRVHPSDATSLLGDLVAGRDLSREEIVERAGRIGFSAPVGSRVFGIVLQTRSGAGAPGLARIADATRKVLGRCLVSADEADPGEFLIAASVRPGRLRGRLADLADALDSELGATIGGRAARLVAGPLVEDVAGLARSLPAARDAAQLADRLTLGARIVVATDLGVFQLLAGLAEDTELERFVSDQLGPLLELDARTRSELVATLDAYLECGLSKTGTAAALGVRRQTVYGRLDRIERALGGLDLSDRQRRTALDLALVAWRLRTAAVSGPGSRPAR